MDTKCMDVGEDLTASNFWGLNFWGQPLDFLRFGGLNTGSLDLRWKVVSPTEKKRMFCVGLEIQGLSPSILSGQIWRDKSPPKPEEKLWCKGCRMWYSHHPKTRPDSVNIRYITFGKIEEKFIYLELLLANTVQLWLFISCNTLGIRRLSYYSVIWGIQISHYKAIWDTYQSTNHDEISYVFFKCCSHLTLVGCSPSIPNNDTYVSKKVDWIRRL